MRNALVIVCADAPKNITLLYKGKPLPYTIFHKEVKQSEVVISKDLNTVIKAVPSKSAPDHPWRSLNLSNYLWANSANTPCD